MQPPLDDVAIRHLARVVESTDDAIVTKDFNSILALASPPLRPRPTTALFRTSGCAGFPDLAGGDLHDVDGVAHHISGRLWPFGVFGVSLCR